jgi:YD repeat-containing protein
MFTLRFRFFFALILLALGLGVPALASALDFKTEPPRAQTDPSASVLPPNSDTPALAAPTPRALRAPSALVVTFTYDNAGRLTIANYSSGKRITYAYDNSGDLTALQILANEMLFMPIIMR